jgi:hypothetical protein
MTIKEFDEYRWKCGDKCTYEGREYTVISVDFVEKLILLDYDPQTINWVRCENVTIV